MSRSGQLKMQLFYFVGYFIGSFVGRMVDKGFQVT